MKTKYNLIHILLITTFLSILLSSCNLSKVKIGEVRMMYGTNEDGRISYDIRTFTGIERGSVQAETGETISFTYQAVLDKGSLMIEWQDPNGEVMWQKNLVESDQGAEEIEIKSSGEYVIITQGKGAAGNFDVSWQVK
jgi:hypothetical protein